jgi:outer membrane biosynthesis protein TonB
MSAEDWRNKNLSNGEQNPRRILSIGFGSSLLLHAAVAFAVGNLWHPADKVLEVTLIEPVAESKPTPTPSLVAKKIDPKPSLVPSAILKKVQPTPTPTPSLIVNKPTPTPVVKRVKPPIIPSIEEVIITRVPVVPPPEPMRTTPSEATTSAQSKSPERSILRPNATKTGSNDQSRLSDNGESPIPRSGTAEENSVSDPSTNQNGLLINPSNSPWRSGSDGGRLLATALPSGESNSESSSGGAEVGGESPGNNSRISKSGENQDPSGGSNQNSLSGGNSGQNRTNFRGVSGSRGPADGSRDFGSGLPGNSSRVSRSGRSQGASGVNNQSDLSANSASRLRGLGGVLSDSRNGSDFTSSEDIIGNRVPGNTKRITTGNIRQGLPGTTNQNSMNYASNSRMPINTGSFGRGSLPSQVEDPGSRKPGRNKSSKISLQCLENCEINIGDFNEGEEVAKDKVTIKVNIGPNGIILKAEIYKSGGNSRIDELVRSSIERIRLSPPGRNMTATVKANLRIMEVR